MTCESSRPIDAPRLVLLIPALTYLLSYVYLAVYHHRWNLWSTVVHESGRYTLLENTFYASHFFGHLPVVVTAALLFAGSWLCMAPPGSVEASGRVRAVLAGSLALLLLVSAAISIAHFGGEDTLSFLLQRKQQPELYVEGGSWNLHLPSTMLQFLLIPVVVWLGRRSSARRSCGPVGAWPLCWRRRPRQ